METKVKTLHTNANGTDKKNSGNEELVKRSGMEGTPFEVITTKGKSFGTMGDYRITETYKEEEDVIKELSEMTWNRIIQVVMILDEVKERVKTKKINKK